MKFYAWIATAVCMIGTAINVKRAILDLISLAFAVWGAIENT